MLTQSYTEERCWAASLAQARAGARSRPTVQKRVKPCACACSTAGGCGKKQARRQREGQAVTTYPDGIEAVTRDYFINLFNWLGDLPFPANLLAYLVNCVLHSLTLPMLAYIVPNLWSHLQSVLNSSHDPSVKIYYALRFIVSDTYGTAICTCLPAELWYYASIGYFKVNNQPDAERAMRHYREAAGRDFIVDVSRLIREDAGVKERIEQGIVRQGGQTGELRDWLQQGHFRNDNWLNTLGNVDLVTYTVVTRSVGGSSVVAVGIRDPYEWHPDVGRSLPCLHTSMENLKHLGARDYMQVGRAEVLLTI
jgi:hypothetical protein